MVYVHDAVSLDHDENHIKKISKRSKKDGRFSEHSSETSVLSNLVDDKEKVIEELPLQESAFEDDFCFKVYFRDEEINKTKEA